MHGKNIQKIFMRWHYEKKNDEMVVHTVYHDTIEYRDNLYKLPQGNINEGDRIRIERYDD